VATRWACKRPVKFLVIEFLFVLWAVGGVVWAQNATPGDQDAISVLTEQVRQLQQQSRELQERIAVLEGNQKVSTAPAPAPAVETPPQVENPPSENPPSVTEAATEFHALHGVQWRGFGEVNYQVLNQRAPETGFYGFVPGSAGNFYTGDFGFFLNARLTEKASVLSEIVFEEHDAQSFGVDLRRLLLRYDLNDHLKLSFGRFQTSIGYYNWAFRSAAWLQTTADRPLVMEFATTGGILPTQAIGVSVTGSIPSGPLGLNYVAEYGSSDTIRPDINGDGLLNDENNGNSVNVAFFLRPDFARGLQLGGSIFHDQISDLVPSPTAPGGAVPPPGAEGIPDELSARWGQTIVNGYVVYVSRGIEFLNEGFLIRHAFIGSSVPAFNTPSFYSQFSKRFGPIRPFVRYQYINASPRNLIYDDIGLRYGPSFGARYDLNDYMAFKAQLDHTVRRGLPDLNGLRFQLAVTF
jgi:hypothetical protein